MTLNPSGLCMCGCGEPAPLAKRTVPKWGYVKGEPVRFIANHHGRTHGETLGRRGSKKRSPTYRAWESMWQRTTNPSSRGFERYGGRGISACDRWKDFAVFLEDMGERPDGMSLDRIDNDGNYEPGNCRWATATTQLRNRSNVRLSIELAREIRARYAAGGISQRALADELGVNQSGVQKVLAGKIWREDD